MAEKGIYHNISSTSLFRPIINIVDLTIRCMAILRGTQVGSPMGFNNYYPSFRMSFPSAFNYCQSSFLETQLGFRGE